MVQGQPRPALIRYCLVRPLVPFSALVRCCLVQLLVPRPSLAGCCLVWALNNLFQLFAFVLLFAFMLLFGSHFLTFVTPFMYAYRWLIMYCPRDLGYTVFSIPAVKVRRFSPPCTTRCLTISRRYNHLVSLSLLHCTDARFTPFVETCLPSLSPLSPSAAHLQIQRSGPRARVIMSRVCLRHAFSQFLLCRKSTICNAMQCTDAWRALQHCSDG